jgi:hypothetical protein
MKRLISFVASVALAFAGLTLTGCASNPSPGPDRHSELFGGGNGEFGESPRQAGEYSNNDRAMPAAQPVSHGQ